jgi:excisionase family DNA binding protein
MNMATIHIHTRRYLRYARAKAATRRVAGSNGAWHDRHDGSESTHSEGNRMPGKRKQRVVLPEATEIGKVYTTEEVAQLLTVTARTVQEWIRTGKLPAVRYGRLYRVRADDLAKFGQETGKRT